MDNPTPLARHVPAAATPPGGPVRYRLTIADPDAHQFQIECTVSAPDPAGEIFAFPAWTPGSYLIRDFARHVGDLGVTADGHPVAAVKLDLHRWQVCPPPRTQVLTLTYTVYAWDLSVRGAYLDRTRGFINGAAVWIRVLGRDRDACDLELVHPPASCRNWRVATTLPARRIGSDGFGHYRVEDYLALIDHPIELGDFACRDFEVDGTPHSIVVSGRQHGDLDRLARDLSAICRTQMAVFGTPPPFRRYLFQLAVVGDGYGGLEHRDSTALLARRDDLPRPGLGAPDAGYQSLLGLASHEYFHAWHVKRLHPADFDDLDLQRVQPTELLWLFEGFTAYYDDLGVCRAGCVSPEAYLKTLGNTIERVLNTPGRKRQSVAEASYDAWMRLYRPDENTPNSTVSYYAKGALVALALDLTLRIDSDGRVGLDHVMRALWSQYGGGAAGITEAAVFTVVDTVAEKPRARLLQRWVHSTDDLPLTRLLGKLGVRLKTARDDGAGLGATLDGTGVDARLARIVPNGAAMRAGLAAGDTLIALDGLRVDRERLPGILARRRPGEIIRIHAFRRDELFETTATLDVAPEKIALEINPRHPGSRRLRNGWLATPENREAGS